MQKARGLEKTKEFLEDKGKGCPFQVLAVTLVCGLQKYLGKGYYEGLKKQSQRQEG